MIDIVNNILKISVIIVGVIFLGVSWAGFYYLVTWRSDDD